MALYKYGFFLTLQTRFKAVGPLQVQSRQYLHGSEQIVTNGIKANHRSRYKGLFGPVRGVCLFSPRNLMEHNEDIVSIWGGVFVTSHIRYGRKFLALYKYGLLVTLQTRFKVVRTHLGPKWIIYQPCRYCSLWTQKGLHDFKTRLQGQEESILIQHQELSPLSDVGCHKHPSMQTQRPRYVPCNYGAKQTNTPYGAKQTPHIEFGDRL